MNLREIKQKCRNSIVTCFLVYIVKYKIINQIVFWLKYFRIQCFGKYIKQKTISSLNNSHIGESCIIVGNGPSVRFEDLKLIEKSNMDSFGANRILDIGEKINWYPTYICVMDPAFIIGVSNVYTPKEYSDQIENSRIQYAFLTDVLKKKISNKKNNIIFVNCPLALMFSKKSMPFSTDASVYISDLGNVTHYSIQMAYYLGYRTIYLYGIDNTYIKYLDNEGKFVSDTSKKSHMQGMKMNIDDIATKKVAHSKFEAFFQGGYADKRKNDLGYIKCREFAKRHGMEIINLTHGGALDVFERESFYSIFGEK